MSSEIKGLPINCDTDVIKGKMDLSRSLTDTSTPLQNNTKQFSWIKAVDAGHTIPVTGHLGEVRQAPCEAPQSFFISLVCVCWRHHLIILVCASLQKPRVTSGLKKIGLRLFGG